MAQKIQINTRFVFGETEGAEKIFDDHILRKITMRLFFEKEAGVNFLKKKKTVEKKRMTFCCFLKKSFCCQKNNNRFYFSKKVKKARLSEIFC